MFERTQDASVLDEAIANELKAIEAWRQIVAAAGDMYADDLMLGVCVADLCGHWKDELVYLEKGLASLEQNRQSFKAEKGLVKAIGYNKPIFSADKALSRADDDNLFQITHQPVTSAPAGKPLTVSVKVSAPAGVKWVRLRYRSVNQEQDYQTLPMLPTGEKDSYQAVVPAEKINPQWDFMYLIEVMDHNGKGRIYPDLNKETPYRFVKLIR
ncbi:hypothetical protein BH24BAC1_BH24BAC1_17120 [soil metagenome]